MLRAQPPGDPNGGGQGHETGYGEKSFGFNSTAEPESGPRRDDEGPTEPGDPPAEIEGEVDPDESGKKQHQSRLGGQTRKSQEVLSIPDRSQLDERHPKNKRARRRQHGRGGKTGTAGQFGCYGHEPEEAIKCETPDKRR